jgi:hypothetical protein
MANFQVPQFLDSGDKILGPLNLRQFGYALGGFMLSVIIFSIINQYYPNAGLYGFLPAVPVAGLAAYAALGKYNGRDADFYIIRFVIFALKPRFLTYSRLPETSDLDAKLGEWTEAKIKERWAKRLADQKTEETDPTYKFKVAAATDKASTIRGLGQLLDKTVANANINYAMAEARRQELQDKIEGNPPKRIGPQVRTAPKTPKVQNQNYFN